MIDIIACQGFCNSFPNPYLGVVSIINRHPAILINLLESSPSFRVAFKVSSPKPRKMLNSNWEWKHGKKLTIFLLRLVWVTIFCGDQPAFKKLDKSPRKEEESGMCSDIECLSWFPWRTFRKIIPRSSSTNSQYLVAKTGRRQGLPRSSPRLRS